MLAAGSRRRVGPQGVMVGGLGVLRRLGAVGRGAGSGVLIAGRAVMGVGAAAREPGTLSMMRHLYTDQRSRDRAIGAWAAVSGLALALGPVIGGLSSALELAGDLLVQPRLRAGRLVLAAVIVPESADPGSRPGGHGRISARRGVSGCVVFAIIAVNGRIRRTRVIALFASAPRAVAFLVRGPRGPSDHRPPYLDRPLHDCDSWPSVPISGSSRSSSSPRCICGGRRAERVPHRPGVPADDRADDRRVAADRPLAGHHRPALGHLRRLRAVRGRPVAVGCEPQPAPATTCRCWFLSRSPGSGSALRSCRSRPRRCRRCRRSGPAWRPRPPTPAARLAR